MQPKHHGSPAHSAKPSPAHASDEQIAFPALRRHLYAGALFGFGKKDFEGADDDRNAKFARLMVAETDKALISAPFERK